MTSTQPQPPHEQNDPRLLLPEWLRDPGEPPKSEPGSNGAARPARAASQSREVANERVLKPGATRSWQEPPATYAGDFNPSTLISFDDLPTWMQRLHENVERTPPAEETRHFAVPAGAAATSIPDGGQLFQVHTALSIENRAVEKDEQASDLSFSGFAWIAGTAIVLIIAAIVVLFG